MSMSAITGSRAQRAPRWATTARSTRTPSGIASSPDRKLTIPVLAIGGAFSLGEEVGVCMCRLAENVDSDIAADCGHWIAEERPQWLTERLIAFLAANRTRSAALA